MTVSLISEMVVEGIYTYPRQQDLAMYVSGVHSSRLRREVLLGYLKMGDLVRDVDLWPLRTL
jgi:hypothetical protein